MGSKIAKVAACVCFLAPPFSIHAEDGPGALSPHPGAQITTAFSNRFGPDAESTVKFVTVTPQQIDLVYTSTRGLVAQRTLNTADRERSGTYVLGYASGMPQTIPQTTSLGLSKASLIELRTTGKTALSLIYDANLSKIDGELTLVEKDVWVPILVEGRVTKAPAVHATGRFQTGDKLGSGDFYFLSNQNNPMLIQSTIQFNWEKDLRSERIVHVTAGASMKSAMEQSLSAMRSYDLYGLHFDFGKATLRPESAALIDDIATTLKNNPSWTLQVNGHTDAIGDAGFNQRLSVERAASVVASLQQQGIAANRLQSDGIGETQPKGDNATLDGRALNRRVELLRTDR